MSKDKMPDLFGNDEEINPVDSALGIKEESEEIYKNNLKNKDYNGKNSSNSPKEEKRKAGFYLTDSKIQELEIAWLRAKLERLPIRSKSTFVELALDLAFEDLAKGKDSSIRARLALK